MDLLSMKRELIIHYSYWFFLAVVVALAKKYLALNDWEFWLGGIFGSVLPDLDHIIYFYFVSPSDLTSRRFDFLAHRKAFRRMIDLLYETRTERKGLIFHTILFQLIFLVLTFWMLSSSGSLFGKGMVLAFALHLSIDQAIDLEETKNLNTWENYLPVSFDYKQARRYWWIILGLILIFGVFL